MNRSRSSLVDVMKARRTRLAPPTEMVQAAPARQVVSRASSVVSKSVEPAERPAPPRVPIRRAMTFRQRQETDSETEVDDRPVVKGVAQKLSHELSTGTPVDTSPVRPEVKEEVVTEVVMPDEEQTEVQEEVQEEVDEHKQDEEPEVPVRPAPSSLTVRQAEVLQSKLARKVTLKKDTEFDGVYFSPLSKSSVIRMAKSLGVASLSSDVHDLLRQVVGAFLQRVFVDIKSVCNGRTATSADLEQVILPLVGGEVEELEHSEFNMNSFSRFVSDLCCQYNVMVKKEAVYYLCNSTEYYVLRLLDRGREYAQHARRSRVASKDVEMAVRSL